MHFEFRSYKLSTTIKWEKSFSINWEPITGPPDYDNPTDALSGKISPNVKLLSRDLGKGICEALIKLGVVWQKMPWRGYNNLMRVNA